MRAKIESTDEIVSLDGVQCRKWVGTSEGGVPVHVFVHRISPQTHDPEVNDRFAKELIEKPKPSTPEIDLRHVL